MKIKAATRILVVFCTIALAATASARAETINIVGLGDSLMAGYELPPSDAFPVRLEAALRDQGHDVTIANAGVSGDTSTG